MDVLPVLKDPLVVDCRGMPRTFNSGGRFVSIFSLEGTMSARNSSEVSHMLKDGLNRIVSALAINSEDYERMEPDDQSPAERALMRAVDDTRSIVLGTTFSPAVANALHSIVTDIEHLAHHGMRTNVSDFSPTTCPVTRGKGRRDADRGLNRIACKTAKILMHEPRTRKELVEELDAERRRVCTIVSILKAIGLVRLQEKHERTGRARAVVWNEKQHALLCNFELVQTVWETFRNGRCALNETYHSLMAQAVARGATEFPPPPWLQALEKSDSENVCASGLQPRVSTRKRQSEAAVPKKTKRRKKEENWPIDDDERQSVPPLALSGLPGRFRPVQPAPPTHEPQYVWETFGTTIASGAPQSDANKGLVSWCRMAPPLGNIPTRTEYDRSMFSATARSASSFHLAPIGTADLSPSSSFGLSGRPWESHSIPWESISARLAQYGLREQKEMFLSNRTITYSE